MLFLGALAVVPGCLSWRSLHCILGVLLLIVVKFIIYVIGIAKIAVHGTWVSGKRIQPGVPVKLKKGDTVKMGGSNCDTIHGDNSSYLERLETNCSNDENSTKEKPFSVLKCSKSCCDDTEIEHSTSPSKSRFENGENCATVSIQFPFIVSESVSETEFPLFPFKGWIELC
ncbi:hypothetical protein L2E82_02479 [Cichorium intybus]|uniref:Uncharacterized protein n=1 Tax=Cichorium intybus TaxID=13427 RepID=A0ACB9H2A1_CICIN|nr:hypothetical protein L2E82_02479 [Cichorium intybus]